MLDLQNHNFLHFYQNPDTETLPNKFRFCQCHSTNIYRLRQTIKSNVFPHNINFQMNPCEIPQNSKRQSSYNLDESQSSSVSIKIYNKNDEDVVIRLYRNNNKSSRDRFNNSFGHQRKSAGRESKTKQKPTMLRNLYRTTFGPTLDETVLVGMETFQICQQEVALNNRAMNAKNPSNEESRNNLIAPHPSREDLQNTDCCNCMPNELSWDCSTLLPANSNPKEFETVCTNTINSEADKEKNLSPLLTNQYHYSPFSNQNEDVCSDPRCPDSVKPAKSPKKSKQKEDKPRPLNNISSDDNLTISSNSRKRSGRDLFFSKKKADSKQKLNAIQKKTANNRALRKSSGYDMPSNQFIINQGQEKSWFNKEDPNRDTLRLSSFSPRTSGIVPRASRRNTTRESTFIRESVAKGPDSPKQLAFRSSLPRISYYDVPSTSSIFEEENLKRSTFAEQENFDGNPRKSSAQRRSTSAGPTEEPPKKMSTKISDFFRRGSRRSTSPDRTVAKPRSSRQSSIPRRSSLPRQTFVEDEEPIQEDVFRKSTIGAEDRQSKGFLQTGSHEDLPRRSSFFPETNDDGLRKSRRSIASRRSSVPQPSLVEDEEPEREDFWRRSSTAANDRNSRSIFNSRRSSSPARSVELGSDEDLPRGTIVSPETYEDGPRQSRRSSSVRRSLPQQSFIEDDESTQDDIWRRSTVGAEVPEKIFSSFQERLPEIEGFIRTGSCDDDPPFPSSVLPIRPEGRRSSASPRRSSLHRKSSYRGDDPIQEENLRETIRAADNRESFVDHFKGDTLYPYSSDEDLPRASVYSQEAVPRNSRRSTNSRRTTLPQKSLESDEDDVQEDIWRRSTVVAEGRENLFNSRRSTSPYPDESPELNDLPCVNTISPGIYETQQFRRSTTPRSTSIRKTYTEAFAENRKSSTFQPRNTFYEEPQFSFEDNPIVSTFSPEFPEHEEDYLPYPSPRQTRRLPREAPASNEICEKPRLGICRCEKGDTSRNKVPQETRYAITRVTKYDDYTTYEILKSTRARPRKIPEVLEKIFIEKDPYY